MPFLWVKVLIFQGSTHQNGVGSLSPIKDSMLINVFVSGFSSQPFDIIRNTSAFIELNQILEEYL